MPVPFSAFSILLLTTDARIRRQVDQIFQDASITVGKDTTILRNELPKHSFDIVVIESRGGEDETAERLQHLNLSRTLLIHGSRAVLRRTLKLIQVISAPDPSLQHRTRDGSLEGYLEVKMGEFVKGMRNGSARNLHPILISAVERPLITSALKETRGNQLQAAELLGLNRNTLRKKIVDLHIPLKQTKQRVSRNA